MWCLSDLLNFKYDSEIIYLMMVEKISEKNLGSEREDWKNMDDSGFILQTVHQILLG